MPVGPSARRSGEPSMYEAPFRADNFYTSEIASAVWIDPDVVDGGPRAGSPNPAAREPPA